MPAYIDIISASLSYLTAIGGLLFLILLGLIFSWRSRTSRSLYSLPAILLKKYGLLAAFIVALVASSGSLFYSEIAGYLPCKLCWFQRVFVYPQVIILGAALLAKKKNVYLYSITLAIIGAAIALFHYIEQIIAKPLLGDCEVIGYSAGCTQYFFMDLGYITMPMMSLTTSLLISTLLYVHHLLNRHN